MEDGQDSDGVVSVTDSEDEEQKAKETLRAFVKQKGVLTLSFHTQSVVYYSYFVMTRSLSNTTENMIHALNTPSYSHLSNTLSLRVRNTPTIPTN